MKTIQELLMHSRSAAVISNGNVRMYWDEFLDGWTVIEKSQSRRTHTELYFGDEAGAVAAFAKATGLEVEAANE